MNDHLTLSFAPKTLDYIAQVLAQRPFAEVSAVLADIQQQVAQQQIQPAYQPTGNGLDSANVSQVPQ